VDTLSEDQDKLPRIVKYKPYYRELQKGRPYAWCSCGLSENQPFCDGSHKGTGFEPVRYIAQEEGEEVLFCGCKHTADKPFCDGMHNNLLDVYETDDPDSNENRKIPLVEERIHGRAHLDGTCFVTNIDEIPYQDAGNLRWSPLATSETGAQHQSQFYFRIARGDSPVVSFTGSHTVLLASQGSGTITVSGRQFDLAPEMGIYVRPDEAFSVSNDTDEEILLYVSVGPLQNQPDFSEAMPDNFNAEHPVRTVAFEPGKRLPMADRSFQMLVDKTVGSDLVTQFIGDIPQSKAAPHRHLYEEVLIILTGEGMMWTENHKAPVKGGDFLFLPRKQEHSLQCTNPEGMLVVGVIYPGDNPSINY
jgi:CDGSH-type Zn-finger protein/mannose-6-phosphate isomerase-like protein (cupin superfamily)